MWGKLVNYFSDTFNRVKSRTKRKLTDTLSPRGQPAQLQPQTSSGLNPSSSNVGINFDIADSQSLPAYLTNQNDPDIILLDSEQPSTSGVITTSLGSTTEIEEEEDFPAEINTNAAQDVSYNRTAIGGFHRTTNQRQSTHITDGTNQEGGSKTTADSGIAEDDEPQIVFESEPPTHKRQRLDSDKKFSLAEQLSASAKKFEYWVKFGLSGEGAGGSHWTPDTNSANPISYYQPRSTGNRRRTTTTMTKTIMLFRNRKSQNRPYRHAYSGRNHHKQLDFESDLNYSLRALSTPGTTYNFIFGSDPSVEEDMDSQTDKEKKDPNKEVEYLFTREYRNSPHLIPSSSNDDQDINNIVTEDEDEETGGRAIGETRKGFTPSATPYSRHVVPPSTLSPINSSRREEEWQQSSSKAYQRQELKDSRSPAFDNSDVQYLETKSSQVSPDNKDKKEDMDSSILSGSRLRDRERFYKRNRNTDSVRKRGDPADILSTDVSLSDASFVHSKSDLTQRTCVVDPGSEQRLRSLVQEYQRAEGRIVKDKFDDLNFESLSIVGSRKQGKVPDDEIRSIFLKAKSALDSITDTEPGSPKSGPESHGSDDLVGNGELFRNPEVPERQKSMTPCTSRISEGVLAVSARFENIDLLRIMNKIKTDDENRQKNEMALEELKERAKILGEQRGIRTKQRTVRELARLKLFLEGLEILEDKEPEPEIDEFPELTPEQEDLVEHGLDRRKGRASPLELLVDAFNIPIHRRDLMTLSGLEWLNDEVMNFYMNLIVKRAKENEKLPKIHAFTTFFYPKLMKDGYSNILKRWTRKIDLFAQDILLCPVHLGCHWCLAVIDIRNKRIEYYDSLGGNNLQCLDALERYLQEEHLDKKKNKLDTSDWEKVIREDIPRQKNGSDCGMFTCKFAEFASRRAKIRFTQEHIPYYRKRMVCEILSQKLL